MLNRSVFLRNPLLTQLCNLGPILTKIMQTYTNDSLYKVLKCSMMGYSSQPKVILVNLPKKFPFWARKIQAQFGPKLLNFISHDSHSETLFEILQHDDAKQIGKGRFSSFSEFQNPCNMVNNSQTKEMLVTFYKKVPFREVKVCNFLSQDLLFENFLRCCSIKEYSLQTIVTINFAKKSLFDPINKLDPT